MCAPTPDAARAHTPSMEQTLEGLIQELDTIINERDQQVDSALSNVAQRLARAIKTRCAVAMAAAAPALEQLRLEEEALQLRHEMTIAAEEEEEEEEEGLAARESMLEPLEGGEEVVS